MLRSFLAFIGINKLPSSFFLAEAIILALANMNELMRFSNAKSKCAIFFIIKQLWLQKGDNISHLNFLEFICNFFEYKEADCFIATLRQSELFKSFKLLLPHRFSFGHLSDQVVVFMKIADLEFDIHFPITAFRLHDWSMLDNNTHGISITQFMPTWI